MLPKLILILLLMHYASSEAEVKFSGLRMMQKEMVTGSFAAEPEDMVDSHERNRRQYCFPPISCDPNYPYRSIDGTCNNLYNPYWGGSNLPFRRYLQPMFGSGINFPPRGTGVYPSLPRPRDITSGIVSVVLPPRNDGTGLMTMQWGQFIDHDFFFTPEVEDAECCADFVTTTPTSVDCVPIVVVGDPFYDSRGVKCLPFRRSIRSPCYSGREQINTLTAYLDGSQVYGSTPAELVSVREPNSHRMRFGPGRENLACPINDPSYDCRTFLPTRISNVTGNPEFYGGDTRVEEQPGLTSMHNIGVRMHNDLADVIRYNNPYYSDEVVFQETRKIVGAIIQQITYNEYLPLVLGDNIMDLYGLTLQPNDGYSDPFFYYYDEYVDATARTEVSTASYRFGHSLLKDFFTLSNGVQVKLAQSFNSHSRTTFTNTLPSHFLGGIAVDKAEELDHILVEAVRSFLFAEAPFDFGEDLYARNIGRGRDHGIPSYTRFLALCNNTCVGDSCTFEDLKKFIPPAVVAELYNLYNGRVNDVDIFPAAMAEVNHPGSLLGPTFTCLNAEHFFQIKFGDRFWFERPGIFTVDQLRSIRNTRLSTLLCLYTSITEFPINVFRQHDPITNPYRSCSEIFPVGVLNDIVLYW